MVSFYTEDINILTEKAETLDLRTTRILTTDNWAMLQMGK